MVQFVFCVLVVFLCETLHLPLPANSSMLVLRMSIITKLQGNAFTQTRICGVHTGYHGNTHQLQLLNSVYWLVVPNL